MSFDAFDVGKKVIMKTCLPIEEVEKRIGSVKSLKFVENRKVAAVGEILAAFPSKNCLYAEVDGVSTVMFFDEITEYSDEILEELIHPPSTTWIPMHSWLG